MQATEQKRIRFYPNPQPPVPPPANPIDFTLLSALVMKIRDPVTGAVSTVTMVPNLADGNPINMYADYVTLSTDFPVAGTYTLQITATFTDGTVLKTPEKLFSVGPSL